MGFGVIPDNVGRQRIDYEKCSIVGHIYRLPSSENGLNASLLVVKKLRFSAQSTVLDELNTFLSFLKR